MSFTSLASLAQIMGRQHRIAVQSGGDTAYAARNDDGKFVINLPAVVKSKSALEQAEGYLDHEIGHCRFTDYSALDTITSPLHKSIANIFEDVFIERKLSAVYPGSARALKKLAADIFQGEIPPNADPTALAGQYILYRVRGELCEDVANHTPDIRKALERVAPGLSNELEPTLLRVKESLSSHENANLAAQVCKILEQYTPPQDPSQDNGPQNGQGSGQQDGQGNGQSDGQSQPFIEDRSLSSSTDMGEILKEKISKDVPQYTSAANLAAPGSGQTYSPCTPLPLNLVQQGLQAATQLESRLAAFMQAKQLNREGSRRRGRIDAHHLYRAALCDQRVFESRVDKIKTNAEVYVIGDFSGSMCGEKGSMTCASMYALCRALRQIKGIRCAAYGFRGYDIATMLAIDEPMSSRHFFVSHPTDGTPIGAVYHRLLQTIDLTDPDPKRFVIVMTDGCADDTRMFEAVLEDADKHGIVTYGVGICDGSIRSLLPNRSEVIQSVHELPKVLFGLMEKNL